MGDEESIWVVTEDDTRRGFSKKLDLEELSTNVNRFLNQIERLLEKAPSTVGQFQFDAFEVSAQLSAKGSLSLLGTGGQAGASGGLKFVFRRAPAAARVGGAPASSDPGAD